MQFQQVQALPSPLPHCPVPAGAGSRRLPKPQSDVLEAFPTRDTQSLQPCILSVHFTFFPLSEKLQEIDG